VSKRRPQKTAGGRERVSPPAAEPVETRAAVDDAGSKGHGAKTAAVRERAILAFLSERSLELAAARADVSERTLRRWLTDDAAFKGEYDAARRAVFQASMSRIQALTGRAVEALEDLLAATDYPSVRLRAARTVAEFGIHQHDAETIMRKLDELEAAQRRGD
jgi:hypothetical protein